MPRSFVAPFLTESVRRTRPAPARTRAYDAGPARVALRLGAAGDAFAAAGLAIIGVAVPGWMLRDLAALASRQGTATAADATAFLVQPGASIGLLSWLVPGATLLAAAFVFARLTPVAIGRAATADLDLRGLAQPGGAPGKRSRIATARVRTRATRVAGLVADGALAGLVGVTLALALLPGLLALAGFRSVTLTSGSMAPVLPAGAFVVERASVDQAPLRPGDIVTVVRPDGTLLTHRVAAVVAGTSGVSYQTRGDAVMAADADLVAPARVVGVAVGAAPGLGGLRAWAFSPVGALAIGLLACALALVPRGRPRAHGARLA